MKVLCVGDIYASEGRKTYHKYSQKIIEENDIDFVIINGENSTDKGRGINKKIYNDFIFSNVDCITMGNHTWGDRELYDFIDDSNIIRPANLPIDIGNGYKIFEIKNKKVAVINLLGKAFIHSFALDCPFKTIDKILKDIKADYIIVDYHAEATSEKIALAHYLTGRVDLVYGTHTHVPTCDEEVLNNKTCYITDIGMTGSRAGVIGVEKDIIINRFLTGLPSMNKPAKGKNQFNAIVCDLTKDKKTIKRINIFE